MKTEVNLEKIGFSWENILVNSHEFEQYPFNPSIFVLKGLADIATDENGIDAIHPIKRETLNKVAEKLSVAVSEYYEQNVSVTITEELIIKVHFSENITASFLSKIINKFKARND